MLSTVSERKYAMTRLRAGSYLLPSNDGQTLWWICKYEEDGSASWSEDGKTFTPIKGEFWQIARRPMPPEGTALDEDFMYSDEWQWYDHLIPSRREAIRRAVEHG